MSLNSVTKAKYMPIVRILISKKMGAGAGSPVGVLPLLSPPLPGKAELGSEVRSPNRLLGCLGGRRRLN